MFSERFDRTIYKYNLFSITPDIKVDDWKDKRKIYDDRREVAVKIMVQPTFRKNIYREIVTGMPIPVYRHVYRGVYMGAAFLGHIEIPSQPAFIEVKNLVRYDDPVLEATAEEIKEYIEEHTAPNVDYKAQLGDIFQKANEYYENAYRIYMQEKNDEYKKQQEAMSMLRILRKKQ